MPSPSLLKAITMYPKANKHMEVIFMEIKHLTCGYLSVLDIFLMVVAFSKGSGCSSIDIGAGILAVLS